MPCATAYIALPAARSRVRDRTSSDGGPGLSTSKRRWALGGGLLVVAASLAWVVAPSPIAPVAWRPEAPLPLTGALAPNEALREADRHALAGGVGPEGLDVDERGRVYAGLVDGRIIRLSPKAGTVETLANTRGRPLGMELDDKADLVVADGERGLLKVAADGRVTTLAVEAGGVPFHFVDDVAIASDGRVYFTDASSRFPPDELLFDLLEARPWGRLLRYDPDSGRTEVLLDDLYFANGVALSADERFVLVTETYRYRVRRYWLTGERAGTSDVFLDRLPGFPDNITATEDGRFWLALYSVRKPLVDKTLHPYPWVKSLMAKVPEALWPRPRRYGLVLELDDDGRVLRSLHDVDGQVLGFVTSALERDGTLWLGSLSEPHVGALHLSTRR